MDQLISLSDLVKAWCSKSLANEYIPSILYYYAKYVRNIEISDQLLNDTLQWIQLTNGFNVELAMHDIVSKANLNVVTVNSPIDNFGHSYVLFRKFYEDPE